MKQVRTAKGRVIDMQALAKANEKIRAVSPGNVNMNARGDRIDSSGNVLQTVQAKSRAAHNTTTAPEQRKMSDVPGNKENKPKPRPAKKAAEADAEPTVIRQEQKMRDDGTSYVEVEYADGSMDVKENDNDN